MNHKFTLAQMQRIAVATHKTKMTQSKQTAKYTPIRQMMSKPDVFTCSVKNETSSNPLMDILTGKTLKK